MNELPVTVNYDHLPFYITAPGETDVLFGAVAVTPVAILIGFGALYFTIQAIPDRIVKGTSKAQMQLVGLLGLISLFTMNNLYWVAAILIAAVRIPDFMTPLKDIARSMRVQAGEAGLGESAGSEGADAVEEVSEGPAAETTANKRGSDDDD